MQAVPCPHCHRARVEILVHRSPRPVLVVPVLSTTPDDIPFGEIFPVLLYVLLFTLTTVAQGLYQGLARPQPAVLWILQPLATWWTVWAWFYAYARRHRIPMIMDLGWLLVGAWPIVVFYYLFKIQRWRALVPVAAYGLLMLTAMMLGWFVRLAVSPS